MSEMTRHAFGKRVRKLRKQHEISLRRFALMIGIDKGFLVDIEHGRKSPTLDTISKIASGLDITISELCQGIDDPDEHISSEPDERFDYSAIPYSK